MTRGVRISCHGTASFLQRATFNIDCQHEDFRHLDLSALLFESHLRLARLTQPTIASGYALE